MVRTNFASGHYQGRILLASDDQPVTRSLRSGILLAPQSQVIAFRDPERDHRPGTTETGAAAHPARVAAAPDREESAAMTEYGPGRWTAGCPPKKPVT
ncbi:hypothetical protein Srufu_006010 [Streptomyces libani subsp. rufus]|nr:hypothetical protein Srufu_006010 [Streptomyces libani subsp. rufus]